MDSVFSYLSRASVGVTISKGGAEARREDVGVGIFEVLVVVLGSDAGVELSAHGNGDDWK